MAEPFVPVRGMHASVHMPLKPGDPGYVSVADSVRLHFALKAENEARTKRQAEEAAARNRASNLKHMAELYPDWREGDPSPLRHLLNW